jgi:hypothetical protein
MSLAAKFFAPHHVPMRPAQILRPLCRWFPAAVLFCWLAQPAAAEIFDFASPTNLTGTIYESGSHRQKVLYTFQRTAVRDGDTVHVERKFFCPDGTTAAVEKVTYAAGRLVHFDMQEFQAGVAGSIEITNDLQNPAHSKIAISYAHNLTPPPGNWQKLPPDTLIDDTIYAFLMEHWDALQRGEPVKFRFVALEWEKTFSFRFIKTGESVVAGRAVVTLKMEPTNLLVASVVDPLFFTLEKAEPHRVLAYVGRTTPRTKKGKSWKYLDAETVFDWK